MNKLYLLIALTAITLSNSCTSNRLKSNEAIEDKELSNLIKVMQGEFSSREQAQMDSLFYNINLVMVPIWEKDKDAKWLYVEQAVTANLKKPYRQRVYRVSKVDNGFIESRVYELPSPSNYIHAWQQPKIFDQINPDSLILRDGCAVYLKKNKDNCYQGSTKDKECKSTLRGAEYATSEVSICANQIVSWDQGWNSEDTQVWGAQTQGYIFKRIND